METSRRMHTPPDGSGRGKRSHDKVDTTRIGEEATPTSLGLLKLKRRYLPYATAAILQDNAQQYAQGSKRRREASDAMDK